MEGEITVQPETVWIPVDDAVLAGMKTEAEPIDLLGIKSESLMQDVADYQLNSEEIAYVNHADVKEEVPVSPEMWKECDKDVKIEIEEHSFLEDSFESIPNSKRMGDSNGQEHGVNIMTTSDETEQMSLSKESRPTAGKRKKWDPESMFQAVDAIKEKKMGYLKASKMYKVPRSTLEAYVKYKTKDVEALINTKLGRKSVLGCELENELEKYCKVMESRYFGLRSSDIRQLAFQLAVKNNIEHPFPLSKGAAGKKWLRNFLKRHPSLSLRTRESISIARAKGFSMEVNAFFDLLQPELEKVGFNPSKVYNVDETGIMVVQSRRSRVLSVKGKKQVGTLLSQERGALMTVVTCMSAAGMFVPPLIVFPRKNMTAELLDGCPLGTIARCHPSGWIQLHIFTDWFRHFIQITKPTQEDPIILILDGHFPHTRNIDVILLAREHGVIIVCLPPHTTHKLQPLVVSFMEPFKAYYLQEIKTWMANHPFRAITAYQIGELMGKAYAKSATLQIAVNGFKKCGIIPFNRNVFDNHEYTSLENDNNEAEDENEPQEVVEEQILPFALRLPPVIGVSSTSTRNIGSAALVMGSPFKNALEDRLQKNILTITRQPKEKTARTIASSSSTTKTTAAAAPFDTKRRAKAEKSRQARKQLFLENERKKGTKRQHSNSSSTEDEDVSLISTDVEDSADEECIYCN